MENNNNPLHWFVAVVTPNTEIACIKKLKKLIPVLSKNNIIDSSEEVTSYVPTQDVLRVQPSTGRRVQVKHVLTPCYLFIYCSAPLRFKIACEAKFILHFLMNRATKDASGKSDFARIPTNQMENFMRMVGDSESPVTIDTSRLRVGSKVRIKTGRLAGLEGNLYKAPDGSNMLALRVDFLGYAKMQCPLDILELVKQ